MDEYLIPSVDINTCEFPNFCTKEGIVAWGGDLSVDRLISAYKSGIFPWFNKNEPILWWSPDPRCVLHVENLKVSKSLRKSIKKYDVTYDKEFSQVLNMCQKVRVENGIDTWIDDRIIKAYEKLHVKGYAHSVEVWFRGELVGGLYGVCIGKIFCGESMFSKKSDASKVALVNLIDKLKKYDFKLIDCQVSNSHLLSLGATNIPKSEFLNHLKIATKEPSGFEDFSYM